MLAIQAKTKPSLTKQTNTNKQSQETQAKLGYGTPDSTFIYNGGVLFEVSLLRLIVLFGASLKSSKWNSPSMIK